MKIIILGAGQVGASLANNLSNEANITIVDVDGPRLQELQNRLDLRTVSGHASHPEVLLRAGAEDADMVIAVTNSDETNMVACQIAHSLFRTPTKIARVRSQAYLDHPQLFSNNKETNNKEALPIDVIINPEQLVTDYIHHLIQYPGTLQVLDFANGRGQLVGVKAYDDGPLVGHKLRTLDEHLPGLKTRVVALYRHDRAIFPQGDTVIEADDEVFFIAAKPDIRMMMSELRRLEKPYKRILIAGGGNIGKRLAQVLAGTHQIKIIEHNAQRAGQIAAELENCIVLHGDAADEELLVQENIADTDAFCALTNDEEVNIVSAMLAKRFGVRTVMALINRSSYVDLVEGGDIDIAISPQQATIGSLLAHVRRGDVAVVHSLRRGAAEAIEAIAHGDIHTSRVVGRAIEEIKLPEGITIGAIVRGDKVLIPHHDTVIQGEDHVLFIVADKRRIPEVEQLFQVAFTFF